MLLCLLGTSGFIYLASWLQSVRINLIKISVDDPRNVDRQDSALEPRHGIICPGGRVGGSQTNLSSSGLRQKSSYGITESSIGEDVGVP